MHTGRKETPTMLAQTKDVVRVGKSPHKQRGSKGNNVKKITKTHYCFQGVFTRNSIRMGKFWISKRALYIQLDLSNAHSVVVVPVRLSG
jgi:hypothetical protein